MIDRVGILAFDIEDSLKSHPRIDKLHTKKHETPTTMGKAKAKASGKASASKSASKSASTTAPAASSSSSPLRLAALALAVLLLAVIAARFSPSGPSSVPAPSRTCAFLFVCWLAVLLVCLLLLARACFRLAYKSAQKSKLQRPRAQRQRRRPTSPQPPTTSKWFSSNSIQLKTVISP